MNLVLDTLTSRRSLRWLGNVLGLLAATGLARFGDLLIPWARGLGLAAACLLVGECLVTLTDRKSRRLRALAPQASPLKDLPPEDRQVLQEGLLQMPRHAILRSLGCWAVVCLVMGWRHWGGDGFFSGWPLAGWTLGAFVAALTQAYGHRMVARRVAPFCHFEGEASEALSQFMPSSMVLQGWMAFAPLVLLLPFPLVMALEDKSVSGPAWIWLILWTLLAVLAGLKVYKDLVIAPIKDLGTALKRFGEGDASAILDITSGDDLGVVASRYNAAVRNSDRRFFLQERFGHMISKKKDEHFLEGGIKLDGEEREVGVIACRLSGERISLAAFNKFCQCIAEIVDAKGGALDEVSPGLVVALFNAPFPMDNAEGVALEAAEEIKQRLDVFRSQQKMQLGLDLQHRVGFSWGMVVLGLAGPRGRQHYTAIGGAAEQARAMAGA